MSIMNDRYAVIYGPDELTVRTAKCLQPWHCTCDLDTSDSPRCGYTPEQLKRFFIQYYKRRADYIEKQSVEDFLYDRGIYG